ncbi:hypothetical protein AB0C84_40390 [Actinomadura sp. NPDC048955]|uniref:hypothetical protein n=1 Tax=Actinomadura sp. NPDC048955 TaxID=3158228 RepID=UPI0033EB7302
MAARTSWLSRPRRRRALIAAALAAVVLTVAAIAHVRLRSPARPPAPARVHPRVIAPTTPAGIPTVPLAPLQWIRFNGLLLPTSPTDGPSRHDDGLAAGFARTPTGALLAALHIAIRANAQWGPRIYEPTITRQVVGADARLLLTGVRESYEQRRTQTGTAAGAPLGPVYAVQEGFRWHRYTPDQADLDLLTAGPGTSPGSTIRAATSVSVLWRGNDWRLLAPAAGDWGRAAAPVATTRQFTLFTAPGGPTPSAGS